MKKPPPIGPFKFSSPLERSTNKLWASHVHVPAGIAKQLTDSRTRRVLCTLIDAAPFQCAILHYKRGYPVISVNSNLRKKLRLEYGMRVAVCLTKDTSEYGLPLPEELKELFRQDDEGNDLFHALTRGKQRTLLYIVGSAKSGEKRIARAITVLNHLKANKGTIDYRQLTVSLKDPRRRVKP